MGISSNNVAGDVLSYNVIEVLDHDLRIIDISLFLIILAITFIVARRVPPLVRTFLLKKMGKRFRDDQSLMELPVGEKRKSIEYFTILIDSFTSLLFWGILLIGFLAASVGANLNIYETAGYSQFQLSIINVARCFSIILLSIFLSRAVPIWLVSILDTFVRNLMALRDREVDEQEDSEQDQLEGAKKSGEEQPAAVEKKRETGEARKSSDTRDPESAGKREYDRARPGNGTNGQAGQLTEYFTTFLRWCILIIGFVYAIATLGLEPDTSFSLFDAEITLLEIVNASLTAIITMAFVIYLLPKLLNHAIILLGQAYGSRHRGEKERVDFITSELERVKPALHRTTVYLFILIGLLMSFSYLPEEFQILIVLSGITKAMIVLAIAFILTILTPFVIYTQSPKHEVGEKSNIYQIGRYINYLILLIAAVTIIGVIGMDLDSSMMIGETRLSGWSVITSLLVLVITIMVGKMIVAMLRDTLLHPDQIDKHASHVLERIIYLTIVFIGIGVALGFLGVNLFAVVTGLGLIGFALAFGMQDTIANFMAGIMIAVERPFKIGDYIRVGDEWGHVIEIGMRSTKILTIQNETVTIPNNLIATGEVWNFTSNNTLYIVRIPVGISYDSNWHQAEDIILKAALLHDRIIKTPEPKVRMMEFGESSIELELRAWITHAKFREDVRSDILKRVKDDFDEQGIEIPYPYRTIVFKRDMIAPGERDRSKSGLDSNHDPPGMSFNGR
jgi:small conductance mechanosensitive channel